MPLTQSLFADDEPLVAGVVIDVPVTLELLKMRFIHRWGYNTTAQQSMRIELDALIEAAMARR